MTATKGLTCGILQSKWIGNCSNNGISERHRSVTLVGVHPLTGKPIEGPFAPSKDSPAVRLEARGHYVYAVPVEQPAPGSTAGPMAGGCYIESSDSRFPADYPIPLHDRFEGWTDHEILSR